VFDPAEGVVPHDEPVTEEDAAPPNKQSVLVPEDTDSTDGEASNAEEMPAPDEEASEPANQEGPTTPAAGTAPATTDSLPPLELPSASPTEEAKPN
jgi:hypothetical protein